MSDLSYNERKIDFTPNVETILDDYGIVSKINSDSSGFDYIPTYAGLEKYPAICVFCKFELFVHINMMKKYIFMFSSWRDTIHKLGSY